MLAYFFHSIPVSNPFKKINIPATLRAGIIAALLFCIPAFFFIRRSSYIQSWLLYLGSFLFLVVIFIHTLTDCKRRRGETTSSLIFASHVATLTGILFACLLCFILLSALVPGYLQPGQTAKALTNDPVNSIHDKTNGLSFQVFMAATIINFSVGSFTGIMLPFTTKIIRKRD